MSHSIWLFLAISLRIEVLACPPQPNGNCYYGQYVLSNSQGGFQNQQCGSAVNRDWCAVSSRPLFWCNPVREGDYCDLKMAESAMCNEQKSAGQWFRGFIYQPATQQANFGCAANFPIEVGGAVCGDGAGFVNQQGCSMVNTPNGPCYFCCCKGGSCNNPQVFAREASKLPINQQQIQTYNPTGYNPYSRQNYYPIPWYNMASQPSNPLFLIAFIIVILLIFLHSA